MLIMPLFIAFAINSTPKSANVETDTLVRTIS